MEVISKSESHLWGPVSWTGLHRNWIWLSLSTETRVWLSLWAWLESRVVPFYIFSKARLHLLYPDHSTFCAPVTSSSLSSHTSCPSWGIDLPKSLASYINIRSSIFSFPFPFFLVYQTCLNVLGCREFLLIPLGKPWTRKRSGVGNQYETLQRLWHLYRLLAVGVTT